MSKIILIDAGFIAFKSITAFRVQSSTIPLAYTFLNMIVAGLKRIGISYDDIIILAKDSPEGSWRRSIYPPYKINRRENREKVESPEFWTEMFKEMDEILYKISVSLPWHVLCESKFEADDFASVCCRTFPDKEIFFYTADSDWSQLLYYKNVHILKRKKKDYFFLEEKNPLDILKQKIEKGDRSDNILGKPTTEKELEIRRTIVSLLELPDYVELPIKELLLSLPQKNINYSKIPFKSLSKKILDLYEPQIMPETRNEQA